MPGNRFKPLVHRMLDVTCLPPIGLQGDNDFGEAFDQCNDGTLVVNAHNGIAFDMAKFFLECRIIGLPFSDIPLEGLFSLTFLMAVWFSVSLHGQGCFIKHLFLEATIKRPHGTSNRHFFPTDDDIGRPSLCDFFSDVDLLFLGQDNLAPSATLLVLLVLLVIFQGRMAFFQKVDDIVNRHSGTF